MFELSKYFLFLFNQPLDDLSMVRKSFFTDLNMFITLYDRHRSPPLTTGSRSSKLFRYQVRTRSIARINCAISFADDKFERISPKNESFNHQPNSNFPAQFSSILAFHRLLL